MSFRLRTLLMFFALWLFVCGTVALISADFAAGFRDGFLDGVNSDFARLNNALRSPVLNWLFLGVSVYLLAFVPLMWLNAKGILSSRIFVRLYLPIWITIGIVGLSLNWLRGTDQPED